MKIYVQMKGSYGNNLFCFALGYALSKEKNYKFKIDTTRQDSGVERPFVLDQLYIPEINRFSWKYFQLGFISRFLNFLQRGLCIGFHTKIYREKEDSVYDPGVFDVIKDTYYSGYWQSEKYFKKYRTELLRMYTPRSLSTEAAALAKRLQEENSVSIHVRRGDYAQQGFLLAMDYYDRAIELVQAQNRTPPPYRFYVFSDDIAFCKEYFSKFKSLDFVFPEIKTGNSTIEDMYLMSQCKHNIIANSSYSWWGAWLNQNPVKCVICPETGIWKGDFYPEEWLKIAI